MNNNSISTIVDQQTITSMEIAEITGRNHKDVMRSIRNMEPAWVSINGRKFALVNYKDAKGQDRPMYQLTKTECLFVATKFNDVARAKLVLRWEQLEKEKLMQQPQQTVANPDNLPADPRNLTRKQLILMALEAEEENEKLRKEGDDLRAENMGLLIESGQKDIRIRNLEEQTAYLNAIMADRSTVTVTQIAQDYGLGAPSFNNLLRGLNIQRRVGDQWILYAEFLDKGYVANRMIPIHHAGRPDTYKPLTAWTQAGRRFLYERLKKHGILPMVERNQAAGSHNV